jgi:hypothetical protein
MRGFLQSGMHHRNDILHMGAGSQFGHHTPVLFMNGLIGNKIGKDLAIANDGGRCFIAGRFDC